jgi:NAD(P)-dependent dehydrogenase (short-subunit alcohol dehydrogenase family)
MASNGKVALVTGASAGIGRACAIALLKVGYAVTVTGRRADALKETLDRAGPDGKNGLVLAGDIADPATIVSIFEQTQKKFGRLDVLFNNAGISGPGKLLEDLDVKVWKEIVDVNLTAAFLCTQQAFKIMKAQTPRGGRIINNGSISAHVPRPNSAPYTATKHAITGLTRSTSLDGRKYDIACGQIDIGNAATEMTDAMARGVPQADGSRAVEPRMDVEDVARAIVFMAGLPLDSNVQFMTVMATKMPFIGRG